jgi:hypothetical protein
VGNTFNDQQNINLPFPSEYIDDGGCAGFIGILMLAMT